jgi:hypothetical protein
VGRWLTLRPGVGAGLGPYLVWLTWSCQVPGATCPVSSARMSGRLEVSAPMSFEAMAAGSALASDGDAYYTYCRRGELLCGKDWQLRGRTRDLAPHKPASLRASSRPNRPACGFP